MSRKNRIWLVVLTVLLLSVSMTATAATTKEKLEKAKQEKSQTESTLKENNKNLDGLKKEQTNLKGTLNNLNEQLTQVSENLADLEEQIRIKEQEIAETQAALDEARANADRQYAVMKLRIQFQYERSDYSLLEGFFKADTISDFLNYFDYVEAVSDYDNRRLDNLRLIRDEIDAAEQKLQQENEELGEMRVQVQAEQARVSGLVSSTRGSIAQYGDQISKQEEEIAANEAKLKQQEADIAALQKQLAEEMRMSQLAAQSVWRDISQVTFAEGDRYLLANLIYCEAGGEPYAGKLAVGSVVINRVLSSVYPDTVTGVIYQKRQFAPVASGRLELALAQSKANAACYQAADEAMAGISNVGNCVYFRTPIPGLTGIQIGNHIFY